MEQQSTEAETTTGYSVEEVVEEKKPVTVQEALQADAQLARTMGLEKFAEHMKSRQHYYQQFDDVNYEDDFVKIKMEDGKLKIETPTGKAKYKEGESKIETDAYKQKTETN
ncbi:hypothetical protein OB13_17245 [Pontibacter sp. HJ8]